ncbi:hypothetical protein GV764_06935 [Atlantibacter hermannii]|nr:hypothetical protein [Atlantibacter hermannii]NBC98754.1 hypothetical protein [Atlantibacter hermannii]
MAGYILGEKDPDYQQDYGSGAWCNLCLSSPSNSDGLSTVAQSIIQVLNDKGIEDYAYVLKFIKYRYPTAVDHLKHYFENPLQGREDIHYDFEMMNYFMSKSRGLRNIFEKELKEAQAFCEEIASSLSPGIYKITSSAVSHGDFREDSADLFYAIGGYQCWGKGELTIKEIAHTRHLSIAGKMMERGKYEYNLLFTFVFFDRYNWNITSSKSRGVLLGGLIPVDDSAMGRFHQMGAAREYNIWGELQKNLVWAESF